MHAVVPAVPSCGFRCPVVEWAATRVFPAIFLLALAHARPSGRPLRHVSPAGDPMRLPALALALLPIFPFSSPHSPPSAYASLGGTLGYIPQSAGVPYPVSIWTVKSCPEGYGFNWKGPLPLAKYAWE